MGPPFQLNANHVEPRFLGSTGIAGRIAFWAVPAEVSTRTPLRIRTGEPYRVNLLGGLATDEVE